MSAVKDLSVEELERLIERVVRRTVDEYLEDLKALASPGDVAGVREAQPDYRARRSTRFPDSKSDPEEPGGATMSDEQLLARITSSPETFGGKPIVRGLRIPVELILSLLAQGATHEEIREDYPDLEEEDLLACVAYARAVIGRDSLETLGG